MSSLAVWFLRAIGRTPEGAEKVGTTHNYTLANALDYAKATVPGFLGYIRDKHVLDHGCGPGWQALAMVAEGAKSAHGVDIREIWIQNGRRIAEEHGLSERVSYSVEFSGRFDVCVSLGAFEHYSDPEGELQRM